MEFLPARPGYHAVSAASAQTCLNSNLNCYSELLRQNLCQKPGAKPGQAGIVFSVKNWYTFRKCTSPKLPGLAADWQRGEAGGGAANYYDKEEAYDNYIDQAGGLGSAAQIQ